MRSSYPADAHAHGHSKVVETEEQRTALRKHLQDVLEGPTFKSSPRCGQFLRYVVEQTIAGNRDSLKERLVGVELFGRSPSYDTGDDAIVRVTASDVRRRLQQYYGTYGLDADFRISLPQGSYVPEIAWTTHAPIETPSPITAIGGETAKEEKEAVPELQEQKPALGAATGRDAGEKISPATRVWLTVGLALTIANIVFACSIFWIHHSTVASSPRSNFPWSAFFASSRPTHLITSDPNVETVQDICNRPITVSDYANRNYIPDAAGLPPELLQSCRLILSANNASSVDPGIAARIGAVAQQAAIVFNVRSARDIELKDLKTDDNYIFLGSPRSDPWAALFNDQLDFRFVYDKALNQEFIRNVHPREHELSQYVPTALGGGTGKSYAIVAFLPNLDEDGHVLLLAGADAEGTEAAGKFVADIPRLASALHSCVSDSQLRFELLLQLDTMAGSPNEINVVACHALTAGPSH